ncbi:MAG: hypothetical protein AAB225_16080 [Acidobacteriota bacterium]
MRTPADPCWHNPRILVTFLLVFLCGATVGMLGMSLGAHRWMHRAPPSWQEGGKEISVERLKKELDLTTAQAEQLGTVLDDFFMYYHTLQTQLDEVRGNGKSRILRILDEEQKRKFNRMVSEAQTRPLR